MLRGGAKSSSEAAGCYLGGLSGNLQLFISDRGILSAIIATGYVSDHGRIWHIKFDPYLLQNLYEGGSQ